MKYLNFKMILTSCGREMKRNELTQKEKRILKRAVLEELKEDEVTTQDGKIIFKLNPKNITSFEVDKDELETINFVGGGSTVYKKPMNKKVRIELNLTNKMYEEVNEELKTYIISV